MENTQTNYEAPRTSSKAPWIIGILVLLLGGGAVITNLLNGAANVAGDVVDGGLDIVTDVAEGTTAILEEGAETIIEAVDGEENEATTGDVVECEDCEVPTDDAEATTGDAEVNTGAEVIVPTLDTEDGATKVSIGSILDGVLDFNSDEDTTTVEEVTAAQPTLPATLPETGAL